MMKPSLKKTSQKYKWELADTIATANIKDAYDGIIDQFVSNARKVNGVEGVILLGGLGRRNFIDCYSDLDMAIFVNGKIPRCMPPFEFHLNFKNRILEFNVHQQDMRREKNTEWCIEKNEAYASGTIVYDKSGLVGKFISRKLKRDEKEREKRIIRLAAQYPWRVNIHTLRCVHRGMPEAAHHLINEGIDMILELIYLVNRRYLPHKKWRIPLSQHFEDIPKDYRRLLMESLRVVDFTMADVKRRICALDKLFTGIIAGVRKETPDFPRDPYVFVYQNYGANQLLKKTAVDSFMNQLATPLSIREYSQIHAYLSLNLAGSGKEVKKLLQKKNQFVNDKLRFKILRELSGVRK